MSFAALARKMADAGATGEAIALALEAMEAQLTNDASRSSNAVRQARYRERKRNAVVTERNETVTRNVTRNVTSRNETVTNRNAESALCARVLYCEDSNILPLDASHLVPKGTDDAKRGHRLPENWQPSPSHFEFGAEKGLTRDQVDETAFEFKNYWLSLPGARGRKLDWNRTFTNRIAEQARRIGGNRQRAGPPESGMTRANKRLLEIIGNEQTGGGEIIDAGFELLSGHGGKRF